MQAKDAAAAGTTIGVGKYPISSEYLESLVLFASDHGVQPETLLIGTDLPPSCLLSAERFSVGNRSICLIVRTLLDASADPFLPVKFGYDLSVRRMGMVGTAFRTAGTLDQAFETMSR